MVEEQQVAVEAITTGEARDRSFSLRFKNLRFGVHCKIL